MNPIKEYDLVVLTRSIKAVHKETYQPILLNKGQVGTVLMKFDRPDINDDSSSYLVDFSDLQGVTYAMETIAATDLIPLIYTPALVA